MGKMDKENQVQSGRSMVEMLGVLAIIGVLSVGGIAGYRTAMNQYEANQIINNITLTATMVSGSAMQRGGSQYLETSDGSTIALNTPYPAESSENDGMFIVKPAVSVFKSEAICKMVLTNYTAPYQIMGMGGNTSGEFETPLSESEVNAFCKKPIRFLWFRFFDDLG